MAPLSSQPPPPPPPPLPLFTAQRHVKPATGSYQRPPRRSAAAAGKTTATKKAHPASGDGEHVVSSTGCRPTRVEKVSVVPLDAGHGRPGASSSLASPAHNSVLKVIFSSLPWKNPGLSSCSSGSATASFAPSVRGEEWRIAATELSRRLIHAARKRDEALSEATSLRHSMSELERKLAGLESYCRDLKHSTLDHHSRGHHLRPPAAAPLPVGGWEFPLDAFLRAVSDARSAVRHLSRSLAAQVDPSKPHDRSGLLFSLEALLSRAFYEDFESAGFQRGGSDRFLHPRGRAEANLAAYAALRGVTWEDVLRKGTRPYSEPFSRFCDRKMGEVAGAWRGRGGAWPEPLLRAIFGAAKGVWLLHLLAWCGHPPVAVFRVDKGAPFDAGFMEDVAAGRARRVGAPATVRAMVAPGFYLEGAVVKSRVVCVSGENDRDGDAVNTAKANVNHSDGRGNKFRRPQKDK